MNEFEELFKQKLVDKIAGMNKDELIGTVEWLLGIVLESNETKAILIENLDLSLFAQKPAYSGRKIKSRKTTARKKSRKRADENKPISDEELAMQINTLLDAVPDEEIPEPEGVTNG